MADEPWLDFQKAPAARAGDPQAGPWADFASKAPAPPAASLLESLWKGVSPGHFVKGVAEGVAGQGVPEGRASEFEGGRAEFGGRAIGTGIKSVAESLWSDVVKPPGEMLEGKMQPGPQAEAAARGTAMGMAGMGGWAPGKMLPGLAERPPGFNLGGRPPPGPPPPPGQLMLPPPTVGVAGQPATPTGQIGATGNFRSGLEAGGRTLGEAPPTASAPGGIAPQAERLGLGGAPRFLPPGPRPGMLPPGPTSTMTHPSASPPPTSPRVAAGLEPPAPTYPTPPPPVRPPPPSNPQADARTVSLYRRAVQPGGLKPSKANDRLYMKQNQDITTGVDQIIDDIPNLRLTAADGTAVPPGSTVPRTMKQLNEAKSQSEEMLFQQWDPMTRRAGEAGLHIDLAPVATELRALAKRPEITDVNPGLVPTLERYADIYEARGVYTPLETQNVIKSINKQYERGEVSKEVLEPIARLLRKQLDEGIAKSEGPGWQRLRDSYGALRSMDKDVTRAVERLAKKPNSGLAQLGNLISSSEFIHGLISLNPAALARAIGAKGGTELHRFINDPNRMIERMFKDRMAARNPRPPTRNPILSLGARAGAIGTGDEMTQRPRLGDLGGLAGIGRAKQSEFEVNPPPGPR